MRSDRKLTREAEMAAAYLSGLTMPEIAKQYGVTRQRVQQLLLRHDIRLRSRPSTAGFQPIDPTDPRFRFGWSRVSVRWWKGHHKRKPIRREQVRKLREWVATTGRTDPTNPELCAIVGSAGVVSLAATWGRPVGDNFAPYTKYLDRLRKLGGVKARQPGFHGHQNHGGR